MNKFKDICYVIKIVYSNYSKEYIITKTNYDKLRFLKEKVINVQRGHKDSEHKFSTIKDLKHYSFDILNNLIIYEDIKRELSYIPKSKFFVENEEDLEPMINELNKIIKKYKVVSNGIK